MTPPPLLLAASFFAVMRNRLIVLACLPLFLGGLPLRAAVIDFDLPEDLNLFTQGANATFWSQSAGVGLGGSGGLTGVNSGTPGWAVLKTPLAPQSPSVSLGIYFKQSNPNTDSSGYSIVIGVGPSASYQPIISSVSGGDPSQNHYAAALQYIKDSDYQDGHDRQYRLSAHTVVDGTLGSTNSAYQALPSGEWYYLSLESSFDAATSHYSLVVHLYASDAAGELGATPLLTLSTSEFAIPSLTQSDANYLFFGISGRAQIRGIDTLDNFTWQVAPIPEPSVALLLGLFGAGLLIRKQLARPGRHRAASRVMLPLICLAATAMTGCGKSKKPMNSSGSESGATTAHRVLVDDGRAMAVIVLRPEATTLEREAAEKLRHYIRKATGVELAMLEEGSNEETTTLFKIAVGQTAALLASGVIVSELPAESYGIKTTENHLFLYGRDEGFGRNIGLPDRDQTVPRGAHWSAYRTPATKWAVNALVEQAIGVRWLWPGEIGTYIPEKKTVAIAEQDKTDRPHLQRRAYRARSRLLLAPEGSPLYLVDTATQQKLQKEARDWMEDHQAGNRTEIFYGHSFSHWWDRYSKEKPDLFAVPPNDRLQQPFPNNRRVKLRLANPAVLDVIEQEYLEAGKPDTWAMTPNDGSGFDTSEETSAWDVPQHQDKTAVWRARGQLTARYVRFWNLVYERLKAHNPNVKLTTLAYSCYQPAPTAETPLTAKLILGVVNNYRGEEAYRAWKEWSALGPEMLLRPNWWHRGVPAPYLQPQDQADYLNFASTNGMIAFASDSLLGYWATQGLNYYVVARVIANPGFDAQQAISEYTSAFGKAEPKIREYFDYWMDHSQQINYDNIPANGETKAVSLYQQIAQRHNLQKKRLNSSMNSFRAVGYLYDDATLAPAFRLLEEARQLAAQDRKNPEAVERVEFLRKGLEECRMTRDLLKLGYAIKEEKQHALTPEFLARAAELRTLRAELTKNHVVWGESLYHNELHRSIPTTQEALPKPEENQDGI